MKSILICLVSLFPINALANCNPVTFEGCVCSPSTPDGCEVERPAGDLICGEGSFLVGVNADGVNVCTKPFLGLVTDQGEIISPLREASIHRHLARTSIYNLTLALNHEYMKRRSAYPVFYHWIGEPQDNCSLGESIDGFCILSLDMKRIAIDHYYAGLYAYQLNDLLGQVQGSPYEKLCEGNLKWTGGNVWKEKSEGRSGGVVVLLAKYCDGKGGSLISNFRIEDALGAIVTGDKFRSCDGNNQGRYHHDFSDRGSMLGMNPVFVRYDFQGKEECRKVENPSNSYR